MSKPTFYSDLPPSLQKQVLKKLQSFKKSTRASQRALEKEWLYQPSRLSPLNYVMLKIFQGQWDSESPSVLPIAIGMARKTLAQAKRFLSHGSL